MSKDFDELITQKQEELNSLKSQMEEVRQQFIQDSARFIREWYEQTARYYVKSKGAEITIRLGKDKLKQMKAKVLELMENAEAIANKVLSDPKLWWHLVEGEDLSYSYFGFNPPYILNKAVSLALGKLGVVLEELGYGQPYHPFGIGWSEEMQNTVKRYWRSHQQAKSKLTEIDSLRKEKKEQQAQNLWDSV